MGYIYNLSKILLNLLDADSDDFEDDDMEDDDDIEDDDDMEDDNDIDDDLLNLEPTSEDVLNAKSAIRKIASGQKQILSFAGRKICATRHGCTGATNCDHAYGAPDGD